MNVTQEQQNREHTKMNGSEEEADAQVENPRFYPHHSLSFISFHPSVPLYRLWLQLHVKIDCVREGCGVCEKRCDFPLPSENKGNLCMLERSTFSDSLGEECTFVLTTGEDDTCTR
jgi:hypothetical protein